MWEVCGENADFLHHNSALIFGRSGILPRDARWVASRLLVRRHENSHLKIVIELTFRKALFRAKSKSILEDYCESDSCVVFCRGDVRFSNGIWPGASQADAKNGQQRVG